MDIITDLSNDLLGYNFWNPHNLNSPHANKIKSLTPSLLDANIPLKQAKEADVVVPEDPERKVNDFFYGTIVVGL